MSGLTLQVNTQSLMMSSREIAQVVESRHDNVKRTMETLRDRGLIAFTQSEEKTSGRPASVFWVGKRDSYVVVAQLSPEFTARLVDRWQELESKQTQTLPQTLPEALRLAADMAEQNAQLSVTNHQQAEEIKALQNLFTDGMTPAQFAKRLNGVNCQKISQELARRGWLYEDFAGGWRVAAYARDKYLTERQSNIPRSSGQVMLRCTPVLLRAGAVRLHQLYLARALPMKASWDGEFTHDKTIEKVA